MKKDNKDKSIKDDQKKITRPIGAAVYLAVHGSMAMQKSDMLNGLQNNYSFRSITAGIIMGLYAFAVENQVGKLRMSEFFEGVKELHKTILREMPETFDSNWILEIATKMYYWLSNKASKYTIYNLKDKFLTDYARMYMYELLDGGTCFNKEFVILATDNIKDYHSIVCQQFSLLTIE